MSRNQVRICTECDNYEEGRCSGARCLITGRVMTMMAQTVRYDNKYCGPSGKLYVPRDLKKDSAPVTEREPREVTKLRVVNSEQRRAESK